MTASLQGNESSHLLDGLTVRGGLALRNSTSGSASISVDANGRLLQNGYPWSPPRGVRLYAIGDSITANGNTAPVLGSASYLMWACIQSGGGFDYAGVAATTGYTTADVLATHVPTVVAQAGSIDACIVHAGVNDFTKGVSFANSQQNLATIYATLQAANITPIATTLLPYNSSTQQNRSDAQKLSHWIRRYCTQNFIPLVDWHRDVVDPVTGDYLAGYSTDHLHPTDLGASVLGNSIVSQLAWMTPNRPATLVREQGDLNNGFSTSNGVMLVDTNADGVPDGWTLTGTDGTQTPSLVPTTDFGNWFRILKTSGTGFSNYESTSVSVSTGDNVYIAVRVKVTTVTGNGRLELRVLNQASASTWGSVNQIDLLAPGSGVWAFPVAAVPSGTTSLKLRFTARSGSVDCQIAQPTFYNLTSGGITI